MSKSVEIRTLRRGSIFTMGSVRYKLLYRNDCRAYVQELSKRTVVIRKLDKNGSPEEREFESAARCHNISPGTVVEVQRKVSL